MEHEVDIVPRTKALPEMEQVCDSERCVVNVMWIVTKVTHTPLGNISPIETPEHLWQC